MAPFFIATSGALRTPPPSLTYFPSSQIEVTLL